MHKQALVAKLLTLPESIEVAEQMVLTFTSALHHFKGELDAKEAELLAGDTIDGKNAETRKAQLHQQTSSERQDVRDVEKDLANEQVTVKRLYNEFSALRSVARLMAGGDDA